MELDAWRIVDVTTWTTDAHNTAGRRAKEWLRDADGQLWLWKAPLDRRPTEPAIEAFTARLARAVGIEAPETHVAVAGGHRATLVRKFLARGEDLAHGSVLLQQRDHTYDPMVHGAHRLDWIRTALLERGLDPAPFVGVLAFDIWVGNSDRHQENWGVITSDAGARIAPAYDTAACLGAELGDAQVASRAARVAARRRYIARCPSGFGDGVRLIPQSQVLNDLLDWPQWRRDARTWAKRFLAARESATRYLETVPDEWWPELRRAFAATMLWRRLVWLWSRLP